MYIVSYKQQNEVYTETYETLLELSNKLSQLLLTNALSYDFLSKCLKKGNIMQYGNFYYGYANSKRQAILDPDIIERRVKNAVEKGVRSTQTIYLDPRWRLVSQRRVDGQLVFYVCHLDNKTHKEESALITPKLDRFGTVVFARPMELTTAIEQKISGTYLQLRKAGYGK